MSILGPNDHPKSPGDNLGVRVGPSHANGGSMNPHDATTSGGSHNGYTSYHREFSSHYEQQTSFETKKFHLSSSVPAFVPPFFAKELLDSDVSTSCIRITCEVSTLPFMEEYKLEEVCRYLLYLHNLFTKNKNLAKRLNFYCKFF